MFTQTATSYEEIPTRKVKHIRVSRSKLNLKVKVKILPITGHEGPEGE
jgi:hypothetical protein